MEDGQSSKDKILQSMSSQVRKDALENETPEDAQKKLDVLNLKQSMTETLEHEEVEVEADFYKGKPQHTEEDGQRAEAESERIEPRAIEENLWEDSRPPRKDRFYNSLVTQIHTFVDNAFEKQALLTDFAIEELNSALFILERGDSETKEERLKEKLESILKKMELLKKDY